ncbi:MAG TPA: TRAP transporter large permease subunit [Roseococcus sp.]|nr:TRAP transporter large permease subunit [Roseococcus sp.]
MDAQASSIEAVPVAGGLRAVLAGLERLIGTAAAIGAAALLAGAFFFLAVSVTARYGFDRPIPWADEFCTFLLLWIATLGFVVAAIRGEHMRLALGLTLLLPRLALAAERLVDGACLLLYAALTAILAQYALHEGDVVSPGMELNLLWKASALPVGFGLLALVQAIRIERTQGLLATLAWLALAAALTLLPEGVRGVFGIVAPLPLAGAFVSAILVFVFLGAPIGSVFAGISLFYLTFHTRVPLEVLGSRMDEGTSSYTLLAIPLFVFLGVVIDKSGVARALVDFMAMLLVRVRGGLSYVLLGSTYVVSGISGSQAADMAAVAPALFPEMKRRGADEGELVALLSSAGAMSLPVPPSLVMIAIGSVCGVSIAAMFAAGFLPALVSLLALCVVVWWRERGRPVPPEARMAFSWLSLLKAGLWAAPVLGLVLIIRAAVVGGVATATEVSTIAVLLSVLLGLLVYRSFSWRDVYPGLVATVSLLGAILFIIAAATAMSWILAQSGLSREIVAAMRGVPGGAWTFIALSIVVFIVLGCVLEGLPAIVLLGPLLFPVARAFGIHDVHYSMIVMLSMGIGLFMPPIGIGFYAACAIGGVDPGRAMRATWLPLLALFVALLVVAAVPWITLVALG